MLEIDEGNINPNGSEYFSNDMIKAVNHDCNIVISMSSKVPDLLSHEENKPVEGGYSYVSDDKTQAYIFISPSNWTYRGHEKGQQDRLFITTHGQIFFHELSGHVIPNITEINGNAIEIKNIIRDQLNLPLREEDENHVCF